MTNDLEKYFTFNCLREANVMRLPKFKNAKGEIAHAEPDGSDWSPAQWLQAVVGEFGEYANIRKKFERGDIDESTFRTLAGKELADIVIYLDILAFQIGVSLGGAVRAKFNEVSRRVGADVFIGKSCVYTFDPEKGIVLHKTDPEKQGGLTSECFTGDCEHTRK